MFNPALLPPHCPPPLSPLDPHKGSAWSAARCLEPANIACDMAAGPQHGPFALPHCPYLLASLASLCFPLRSDACCGESCCKPAPHPPLAGAAAPTAELPHLPQLRCQALFLQLEQSAAVRDVSQWLCHSALCLACSSHPAALLCSTFPVNTSLVPHLLIMPRPHHTRPPLLLAL